MRRPLEWIAAALVAVTLHLLLFASVAALVVSQATPQAAVLELADPYHLPASLPAAVVAESSVAATANEDSVPAAAVPLEEAVPIEVASEEAVLAPAQNASSSDPAGVAVASQDSSEAAATPDATVPAPVASHLAPPMEDSGTKAMAASPALDAEQPGSTLVPAAPADAVASPQAGAAAAIEPVLSDSPAPAGPVTAAEAVKSEAGEAAGDSEAVPMSPVEGPSQPMSSPGSVAMTAVAQDASPAAPDAVTAAIPESPTAIQADDESPVSMLPEGLESHTPAPLSSDGGAAGQQTALLAPASPRKPDLSPLIESFLANYDGGECFLSIPRRISADAAEVLSYGRSAADFERMIERFRDAVGVRLAVEPRPITENQCGALELARHFSGGATPLAIRLAQDQVNDGAVLTADVTGYSHPWIYVLLVDDEGMLRELSSYASSIDGRLRLAVPVHASGDGYDKTQLLIAVSSTRELTMMDIPERAPLANALPLIIGQRKLLAADTEVAVAAFRVR